MKKYFSINLDKAIGENTFKSNISLSTDMSIFFYNARWNHPYPHYLQVYSTKIIST